MKQPYRSPPRPFRLERWSALAGTAILGVLIMQPVWALRRVQVYEVTVRGASASTVVADGMRQALVRATGRRDAPAIPSLAGIVQNANQYLRGSRPLPGGAVQVDFDAVLLAQAITAAGANIWDAKRPFTLVAISPTPNGPAGDALRVQMEQTAEERGLPISVVPLAVTDNTGAALPDDTVLQSAQALGADAVLIGRADPASPGQWQWHLASGASSQGWSGGVDVGINGAADSLANVAVNIGSKPLVQVSVQVMGVSSLVDYARVEQLLRLLPGVQSSGLTAAHGTQAVFAVGMRGGGEALTRAVAGSAHLSSAGTGETQVQLTYMP